MSLKAIVKKAKIQHLQQNPKITFQNAREFKSNFNLDCLSSKLRKQKKRISPFTIIKEKSFSLQQRPMPQTLITPSVYPLNKVLPSALQLKLVQQMTCHSQIQKHKDGDSGRKSLVDNTQTYQSSCFAQTRVSIIVKKKIARKTIFLILKFKRREVQVFYNKTEQ